MTQDSAKKLVHLYAKILADLNQSVRFIQDHDEKFVTPDDAYPTANVMGSLIHELFDPILKKFPEFDHIEGTYIMPQSVYEPFFYREGFNDKNTEISKQAKPKNTKSVHDETH
jgi:hypothetical protein